MESNEDVNTSSTLQRTADADLVQSCDSEHIVDNDGWCEPFVFRNTEVEMGQFTNQLHDNVFSMTSSTPTMDMQQNDWWRPHNLM